MIEERPVRDAGFVGTLFEVPDSPRRPVLVLPGTEGGIPREEAQALARAGHTSLALGWFGIGGLLPDPLEVPLEGLLPAVDLLASKGTAPVGVIGWSYGGMLALQLAALHEAIGPVVGHVASGVRMNGLVGERNVPRAPFSVGGIGLPFLSEPPLEERIPVGEADGRLVIDLAAAYPAILTDTRAVDRATIEIERAAGPFLLSSGGDDRAWASPALCEIAVRRLATARRSRDVVHRTFPSAGHFGLLPGGAYSESFEWPDSRYRFLLGGSQDANAAASAEFWPEVLAFMMA